VLAFSAPAQLDEAVRVLSMTPLPTTRRLSQARQALSPGAAATPRATRERARVAHGPNSHWLSRLPAALKSTKGRLRVVAALRDARAAAMRGDRFLDRA
jgi:hypothetical protein